MSTSSVLIVFPPGKSGKISTWKVKEGASVSVGCVLLLYDINTGNGQQEQKKLKSTQIGIVRKLLAKEGDTIQPGMAILELEECTHPVVMNAMCAKCGSDLKTGNQTLSASVPNVYSIPQLKVSEEQAEILGNADEVRLLKEKKLVLLVNLDQTLIHTTNDNIPPNLNDVYHFQLYGPNSPWYHTRIRPGTQRFLSEMSKFYELHICTFGARNYAHMIAMFLDPYGQYFSHRIMSRDECFNPNSKTANLKALFPCGDNMVCIIDDREDVWNYPPNLIHVKPYHFFQHTGDINAPPGLAKCENDEKEGFDFTKLGNEGKKPMPKEKSVVNCSKTEAPAAEEGDINEDKKVQTEQECGKKDHTELESDRKTLSEKEQTKGVEVSETKTKSSEHAGENCVTVSNVKDDLEIMDNENEQDWNKCKSLDSADGKTVISKECGCDRDRTPEKVSDAANDKCKNVYGNDTDELVEVEDTDDYLLYLEEILKTIHHAFYELCDEEQEGIPDLKNVISYVRHKVLTGTHLVFSGLVPRNVELEKSRVYQVAISLGAKVTQDITPQTTHLVAVRPDTAKVNIARWMKGIFIVTPEWLWCCAERWEHVNELLYPVKHSGTTNGHLPPHCGSPEPNPAVNAVHQQPAIRHRTPSGRFMDTINPLISFSPEDIASMDREVEDIFNESESDGEEVKKGEKVKSEPLPKDEESSSSSSCSTDTLSGEHPHDKLHRKRFATDLDSDDFEDNSPIVKFRCGKDLPSDLDLGEEEDSSNSSDEPPDEVDDGEWNMMGAALEREFLSED
ncbi:RNA polymerase II subunit A C-terminal domain phosphatase-like [Anabrus simplex]|uniref:RNA polymerase II subunit A C-terminal domain phosphatase-like n=1 Tax=Anabrus simplex TaxID=316456 RepID=UPI0034DD055F